MSSHDKLWRHPGSRGLRKRVALLRSQIAEGSLVLPEPDSDVQSLENIAYTTVPTLEHFIQPETKDMLRRFFQEVPQQATVYAEVNAVMHYGLSLHLLCVVSGSFQRDISACSIKSFIPAEDIVPQSLEDPSTSVPVDLSESFKRSDLFRCHIKSINRERCEISLSALPVESVRNGNFGRINEDELPGFYRAAACSEDLHFDGALAAQRAFANPGAISCMTALVGLTNRGLDAATLAMFPEIACSDSNFDINLFGHELRQTQAVDFAAKIVARGVATFREGNTVEAMNFYNTALESDPNNVDGLVARGALYASTDSLRLACKDLETALRVDPTCANARSYLVECLQRRMIEVNDAENSCADQIAVCERLLQLSPGNEEAPAVLEKLKKQEEVVEVDEDDNSRSTTDVVLIDEDDQTAKNSSVKSGCSMVVEVEQRLSTSSTSTGSTDTAATESVGEHRQNGANGRRRRDEVVETPQEKRRREETPHEKRRREEERRRQSALLDNKLGAMEDFIAQLKSKQKT